MYVIILNDENRVQCVMQETYAPTQYPVYVVDGDPSSGVDHYVAGMPENYVPVEAYPDGDLPDYRYVDGEYVYDPLPVPEEPETEASVWDELDAAYQEGVDGV